MPQITLEYSGNIRDPLHSDRLFKSIHTVLFRKGRIELDNCKSRAVKQDSFYVGDGDPRHAFVHLEVRFISGRSDTLKRTLGHALMEVMQEAFPQTMETMKAQITVEIKDINRDFYVKYPEGTFSDQTGDDGV